MSKIEDALRKARGQTEETRTPGLEPAALPARHPLEDVDLQELSSRAIARMREPWHMSKSDLVNNRIIHPGMEDRQVANAFREARTNILQRTKGKNSTILVTSTGERAGSSFVALNLATAFSFDESRTALLLDCNLDRPAHHRLLPTGEGLGLTDYLDGDGIAIEQIIHSVGIDRLRLVPAGGRHGVGGEYFTSTKMRRLLKDIRERYPDRYVFLDAPPITQSADSRILVELCDYALLVVPYGGATESQIAAAARIIGSQKLLGVIFNNEPRLPALSRRRGLTSRTDGTGMREGTRG